MMIIFLIVTLLLLLCDWYILVGVLDANTWWLKSLVLIPSVAYIVVMLLMLTTKDIRQGMLNLLFWLTLCIVIPTLLFTVLSLLGKGIGLAFPSAVRIVNWTALLISAVWIGISLYGIMSGWKKIAVERIVVSSDRIPESFNGYNIVHLSDFHIGTYASAPDCVTRIVEKVNSLNPDLIVFTGDLVNSSSQEIEEFVDILSPSFFIKRGISIPLCPITTPMIMVAATGPSEKDLYFS